MKFFKSPFIFLSLFLCSLLSAQDAEFEFNLKPPEKSDLGSKVEFFVNDFIQPMVRGDAYDITINNVELMTEYQKNNPIYCQNSVKRGDLFCHDKGSYAAHPFHKNKKFEDVPGALIYPFAAILNQKNLNAETSVIVSFQLSLKEDFENSLIQFLEEETTGKDQLRYEHRIYEYALEPAYRDYSDCMGANAPMCKGSMNLSMLNMPLTTNNRFSPREANYVINFIDRSSKKVTFYNLKDFRWELYNNNSNQFLVNLCQYMYDTTIGNKKPNPKFNDLLIAFTDENKDSIYETVINTHQLSRQFQTSTNTKFSMYIQSGQHTFGIERGNLIFAHDYGSNTLPGEVVSYQGTRNIMGHLIDSNKDLFSDEFTTCKMPGLSAENPAFSIISNFEFHLILDLDQIDLKKVKFVRLNYSSQ